MHEQDNLFSGDSMGSKTNSVLNVGSILGLVQQRIQYLCTLYEELQKQDTFFQWGLYEELSKQFTYIGFMRIFTNDVSNIYVIAMRSLHKQDTFFQWGLYEELDKQFTQCWFS